MTKLNDDVYVIGYGRFNPPTRGHQMALFNKIGPMADKLGGRGIILTTRTHNKLKNPLTVEQKKYFIKNSVRSYFKIVDNWIESTARFCISDCREIISALTDLKQASRVVILLGEDEMKALKPRIELYNNDKYFIDNLEFVHAGSRSDGSEIGSISATKMRQAVKNDDYETFDSMCPTLMPKSIRQEMFQAVREGM